VQSRRWRSELCLACEGESASASAQSRIRRPRNSRSARRLLWSTPPEEREAEAARATWTILSRATRHSIVHVPQAGDAEASE